MTSSRGRRRRFSSIADCVYEVKNRGRERPGHLTQLSASDGDCPPGTVEPQADFTRAQPGDQDTILLKGGQSKSGRISLTISRSAFPNLPPLTPQHCRLVVTARTVLNGNFDPTQDNTVTVDVTVRALGG